jgi:hypothetical protein
MFLQRSPQKGLKALLGAYKLGPPQDGHVTVLVSGLVLCMIWAFKQTAVFRRQGLNQAQRVNSN